MKKQQYKISFFDKKNVFQKGEIHHSSVLANANGRKWELLIEGNTYKVEVIKAN